VGRIPDYDRKDVLTRAAGVFGALGYAGCSVEDLVQGLGVHRGSLYNAFGSKRGLFIESLRHHVAWPLGTVVQRLADPGAGASPELLVANAEELDLLLVAAIEAGRDPSVQAQLGTALTALGRATRTAPDAPGTALRTAGLLLLSCRPAWHATPSDELPQHLPHLSTAASERNDDGIITVTGTILTAASLPRARSTNQAITPQARD
jgi:TetR/AcrR family transcriptional repressor of nem operon